MSVVNLRIDLTEDVIDFDCETCVPHWGIRLGNTSDQIHEGFRLLLQHLNHAHPRGPYTIPMSAPWR